MVIAKWESVQTVKIPSELHKRLSYKAPNVKLNEDRIEEVINKEMDNLQKDPITESLSEFDTSSESINKFL